MPCNVCVIYVWSSWRGLFACGPRWRAAFTLTELVVSIEQRIEDAFGAQLSLLDEQTMSVESSPLRDVGALADHIAGLLEDNSQLHA